MNLRIQELLPFYLNGTLTGEEHAWVERQLAEHADARAELEALRALQSDIQHSLPEVPETIGLDKLMTRIRAEQPGWLEHHGPGHFRRRRHHPPLGRRVVVLNWGHAGEARS